MQRIYNPTIVLLALLLTACTTLYRSVVSISQIVDGAAKTYATLYNDGLVPPDLAVKVSVAHMQYRTAARTARDALVAYKAGLGDQATYDQAFAVTLQSATGFVSLLLPLLPPHEAISLQNGLKLATAL